MRPLLLLVALWGLLYVCMPRESPFGYDYTLTRKWLYPTLEAPFSFPIRKNPLQLQAEREEVARSSPIFVVHNPDAALKSYLNMLRDTLSRMNPDSLSMQHAAALSRAITDVRKRGVLNDDPSILLSMEQRVIESPGNRTLPVSQYYTSTRLLMLVKDSLRKYWPSAKWDTLRLVQELAKPNLEFQPDLMNRERQKRLENISATSGMITGGESVIEQGDIITPEKFQRIESLRLEMQENTYFNWKNGAGYAIVILILILVFALQILGAHKEILEDSRQMMLILTYILIFSFATSWISGNHGYAIYNIPYTLVPLVLATFFRSRLAILTHLFIILTNSLIVQQPLEFIIIQVGAGIAAVMALSRLRYAARFFVAAIISYVVSTILFIGLSLIKMNPVYETVWTPMLWLLGAFALTLLAYPLIYINERIFGSVSDLRLRELGDVTRPILQELLNRAPGTFQHSLQVANIAETVVEAIGGNSLLARIGGLYHDIGKLYKPEIFIENRPEGDMGLLSGLDEAESANLIIQHVTKGIEYAEQHGLPKEVINFIRVHHGTTRVEYFYRQYLRTHEDDPVDVSVFTYPGPRPQTCEQAVLMMADSCEAAARSLKHPTASALDNLVDNIIDGKMRDHQLDEANITLSQINQARSIIKNQLFSIYHARVEYPEEPVRN